MIRNIVATVALLALGSIAEPAIAQTAGAQPDPSTAPGGVADTVHVAPPTGEQVADRASILAALAQVGPGDVIQFAPGTYVVGEIIPIETAHLTILGHGDGTTLRGCHPGAYERMRTDAKAAGDDQWARMTALLTCGVFEMTGGHGTIRGLTFEYTAIGQVLGAGHSDSLDFHIRPGRVTDGGYLALVVSGTGAYESGPSPAGSSGLTPAADSIHVAPPTGEQETDRASILAALEQQRSMPLEARAVMGDWFAWKMRMVGEMHRAGVPILAGTDVNSDGLPPFLASGFSLHEELELLVEAGLSPADALRTATLNPARFLGATDSLGTVESGKVADLVLLEHNPLEDIGNTRRIRAVVLNGRLLTHDDLSTLRKRVLLQNDRKGSRTPDQDAEVPRTRTFPGISFPAFPYAQPEDVGLSSEKLDRLGDEITTWLRHGDFVGGEVVIVKDRKTVFHEAYGWSDREAGKPVERNSIWSVKSMSKPFTATAALMVAEEGRLSLDDPVSRYIPRFPDDRVTIRHLLTHTSGYGDDSAPGGPEFSFASLRTWVEDWAVGGPTEPLGEYHYSDFNYAALGYIVEEVTGTPIDQFTEERIIRPLGLDDTSTAFSDDPAWRARLNGWYRREDDTGAYHLRWRANRPAWPYYPAAWGLFSTAMDYAGFMTSWLDKGRRGEARLLAEATVEEALGPHAVHSLGAYGYGWNVNERPKTNAMPSFFGHHGGDGTMAVAFPGVDAVVVFLTHSRGGAHLYALIEALSMLEVFDHPGSSFVWADGREVTMAALTGDERARYAGSYRGTLHDYGSEWAARVWEEEGRLHLRAGFPGERAPFWWWHLVPLGDGDFAPGRYEGDRLEAIHPHMSVRFVVEGERAPALYVMNGRDTLFSGRPADPERMVAGIQAARSRTSLLAIVFRTLEAEGIGAARERFRALRGAVPDSIRLHEVELNALGYGLLSEGRVEEAIAVFEMNAEAFPEAANTHDSLGEAYYAAGRLDDARRSYERAVQLAEAQEDENLPTYRANLERVMREVGGRGEPDLVAGRRDPVGAIGASTWWKRRSG